MPIGRVLMKEKSSSHSATGTSKSKASRARTPWSTISLLVANSSLPAHHPDIHLIFERWELSTLQWCLSIATAVVFCFRLHLLKFENIVFLQVAKIMYTYKNGQLPESFKNMFFTGREIHNYNTRNKNFFRLSSCRTNVRKFSLRFQGPKIFNSINAKIKNSLSLREFSSKLKSTFLD